MPTKPEPGTDGRYERIVFGKNFRRARRKRRQNRRMVQHATGIARSDVNAIELGATDLTLDTMEALAMAVNIPLWRLLKPWD
jgi:hypothetical protein